MSRLSTVDGNYVTYKRPNNQRSIMRNGFRFDNRWVVPFNAYLSAKYDCHINMEVVVRERAVKYIYKYIYKGPDRVTHSLEIGYDEITRYESSMYICAAEAVWKLLEFPTQERSHTVVQLAVHLEDSQMIVYNDRDTADTIQARGETTLTQFLLTCAEDPTARELLYSEFPRHFVWAQKM